MHDIAEHSFTLCPADREEDGVVVLRFEAESDDEASFVYNQFLHFEPYRPFDPCWIAKVRHHITIDHKPVSEGRYEIRTLIVIAEHEEAARSKILAEAQAYGQPYDNGAGESVRWSFDKILSLEEADFFHTIDLYRGLPVELSSRRVDEE